jgi:hypothetical protein
MLSEEELHQLVLAAQDEIRAEVVKRAKESVQYTVSTALCPRLSEVVKEIIEKEVMPGVREELERQKLTIRDAIITGVAQSAAALSEAVVHEFSKELSYSHKVAAAMKALFN